MQGVWNAANADSRAVPAVTSSTALRSTQSSSLLLYEKPEVKKSEQKDFSETGEFVFLCFEGKPMVFEYIIIMHC